MSVSPQRAASLVSVHSITRVNIRVIDNVIRTHDTGKNRCVVEPRIEPRQGTDLPDAQRVHVAGHGVIDAGMASVTEPTPTSTVAELANNRADLLREGATARRTLRWGTGHGHRLKSAVVKEATGTDVLKPDVQERRDTRGHVRVDRVRHGGRVGEARRERDHVVVEHRFEDLRVGKLGVEKASSHQCPSRSVCHCPEPFWGMNSQDDYRYILIVILDRPEVDS